MAVSNTHNERAVEDIATEYCSQAQFIVTAELGKKPAPQGRSKSFLLLLS